MAASLNQDDIKLLKAVFATREEIQKMIEDSELSIIKAVTTVELKLRGKIRNIEESIGISTANWYNPYHYLVALTDLTTPEPYL